LTVHSDFWECITISRTEQRLDGEMERKSFSALRIRDDSLDRLWNEQNYFCFNKRASLARRPDDFLGTTFSFRFELFFPNLMHSKVEADPGSNPGRGSRVSKNL